MEKINFSKVFIYLIVFTFFTSINLFAISDFVVSVKKIIFFISIFILMILLGEIRLKLHIFLIPIFLGVIYNFNNLLNGHFNSTIMFVLFSNIFFLDLLLEFLKEKKLKKFFIESWAYIAVFSSILGLLQLLNFMPQISDNVLGIYSESYRNIFNLRDSFQRGTGLMLDPNFFSIYLIIGLIFNRFYIKNSILEIVIVIGIISTLSRMAFLFLFVFYILTLTKKSFQNYLLLIPLLLLFIFLIPDPIKDYIVIRFLDLRNIFDFSTITSATDSSATSRIITLFSSFEIIQSNIISGIGYGNVRSAFEAILGYDNVTHNTFLELIVISGILGVFPILFIFYYLKKLFLMGNEGVIISIIFFISFMLLSIISDILFLLPLFIYGILNLDDEIFSHSLHNESK